MPKVVQIIQRLNGVVELICEHGVGHPSKGLTNPAWYYDVHGCDGCCSHESFRPSKEQIARFKNHDNTS